MKKKKVLLALLASACVAASAMAFAACQDNGNQSANDPALYAAYQTYAADKTDPMSYDEWVANIIDQLKNGGIQGPKGDRGEEGVGIKDVNIVEKDGKLYFRFTLSNGSEVDVLIDNSVE